LFPKPHAPIILSDSRLFPQIGDKFTPDFVIRFQLPFLYDSGVAQAGLHADNFQSGKPLQSAAIEDDGPGGNGRLR
jgi:hypothetical protein